MFRDFFGRSGEIMAVLAGCFASWVVGRDVGPLTHVRPRRGWCVKPLREHSNIFDKNATFWARTRNLNLCGPDHYATYKMRRRQNAPSFYGLKTERRPNPAGRARYRQQKNPLVCKEHKAKSFFLNSRKCGPPWWVAQDTDAVVYLDFSVMRRGWGLF